MWHQSGADVLGAQLRPSSLPAASCDRRPAYPLIRCSLPETLVFPGVPLDRSSSTFTPGSPSLPPSLTPGPGKPQVFPPLPPPLTPLEAGVAARLPWHQCTALSRGVQPSSGPEPWDRKWCWQMGEGCESHLSPRRALSSLRWTRGRKNRGLAHPAPLSILCPEGCGRGSPSSRVQVEAAFVASPADVSAEMQTGKFSGPVRLSLGCSNTGLNAYPSPLILPRLWECRCKLLQNEPESSRFDRGFRSVALVVPGPLGAC